MDDDTLIQLTNASRILVQVIENGMSTGIVSIQDGYRDMITGPMGVVKAITDQLPGGSGIWTGSLSEDEVKTEWINTIGDDLHSSPATGVRLTHRPTGIIREAASSGDRDRNKGIAWLSLEKAVAKRYRELNV